MSATVMTKGQQIALALNSKFVVPSDEIAVTIDAAIAEAVALEREECAQLAFHESLRQLERVDDLPRTPRCREIAEAIRARGKSKPLLTGWHKIHVAKDVGLGVQLTADEAREISEQNTLHLSKPVT